jgi:hypothetical protein
MGVQSIKEILYKLLIVGSSCFENKNKNLLFKNNARVFLKPV